MCIRGLREHLAALDLPPYDLREPAPAAHPLTQTETTVTAPTPVQEPA